MIVATSAGPGLAIGLFFTVFIVVFMAFWVVSVVFWIMGIIDIARRPEWQFRAAGTEKTMWLLLVILINFIVPLIYWFKIRKRLVAVEGSPPPAFYGPYGGYPGAGPSFGGYPPVGPYGGAPGLAQALGGSPAAVPPYGGPPLPPPPGWHPDPSGRHTMRYWDGQAWTDQVDDRGVTSTDPL